MQKQKKVFFISSESEINLTITLMKIPMVIERWYGASPWGRWERTLH